MTILLVCGFVLELLLATEARLMTRAAHDAAILRWLLPVLLAAFVPFFVAVWRRPRFDWQRLRWMIVGVAVVARLTLLAAPPLLSGDVHRYLWEGKIQNAGFNPYRFSPDAPELARLRDANWEQVEHREVPTAYPPLSLWAFRAGAATANHEFVFKLMFSAFDLVALSFLIRLLRARRQDESLALIWAWNPLVILEFAGNGHEMSMAICFFVAGLWMLEQRYVAAHLSAVVFALAVLSHLWALPLVLAVLVAARIAEYRFWATFVLAITAAFLPFADAGRFIVLGLTNFAARWRFNGSLFELLIKLCPHEPLRQLPSGVWVAFERPKQIAAAAIALVFIWTMVRRYRPSRAAFMVAGAVLLLSPVVHPWYVTWMVALCCVELSPAWLVFSALVLISYSAKVAELRMGVWIESEALRWLEYAPLFALLVAEFWRKRFDSVRRAG